VLDGNARQNLPTFPQKRSDDGIHKRLTGL